MSSLPKDTTTIEELIEAGKGVTLTYFNTSFLNKMSNGTWVTILNSVSDYISELTSACVNVSLTTDQQITYFYKPKLLCSDIYGNPELYYVILLLNDMADVKEFNKSKIKMLPKAYMNMLMGYIYNSEKKFMDMYNSDQTM